MKKGLLILGLLNTIMYLNVQSQDADSIYYKKKPKFCMAKITRMNGDQEKYALFGFTNDSIIVFPLLEKENKKEIQVNNPQKISCKDVKRAFIKIDRSIVLPDSISIKAGLHDNSIVKTLKSDNIKNELVSYGINETVDQFLFDYFESPGLNFLSLGIGLLLGPSGKIYYINGGERKFNKMVKSLTKRNNETENLEE